MMAAEITMHHVLDEVLEELAAALAVQTVVHNILDEPITETTKGRLLAPLLPKEFASKRLARKMKMKNTRPSNGLERFDPYHLCISNERASSRKMFSKRRPRKDHGQLFYKPKAMSRLEKSLKR